MIAVSVLLIAATVALLFWFHRPSQPAGQSRLIVIAEDPERWRLVVESQGTPAHSADTWDLRLPAGRCVIRVFPAEARGGDPESIALTLEPGRVHVCALGGVPVHVDAVVGDRVGSSQRGVAGTGPLCWGSGGSIQVGDRQASHGDYLGLDAEVQVYADPGSLRADADSALLTTNPYDEPLRCSVDDGDARWEFTLAGSAVRVTPCQAGRATTVETRLGMDGPVVDTASVTPLGGLSLFTIGGSTCYVWEGDWPFDAKNDPDRILPDRLLSLTGDSDVVIRLADPQRRDGPDDHTLLWKRHPRKGEAGLTVAVSGPLLAPTPAPLGELTTHPDVRASQLPIPDGLRDQVVTSAAVVGQGVVAVADGAVYDWADGRRLDDGGPPVASIAFSSSGLFLVTRQGRSAAIHNGRLIADRSLVDPTLQAWAAPGADVVYLYGGKAAGGLYAVAADGVRRLLDDDSRVTGLGTARQGFLAARGRRIDRVTMEGDQARFEPIVDLPEGPPVVGLCEIDDGVVFATEKAVYQLKNGVVLPLVLGAGGPLYPYRGGLLLHDRSSWKLLLLEGSFRASAGDPGNGS
ncbi:MAG TPA: hypothetical protein VMS17_16105 [Gemmataceae bacterium]|nr:hypothetical protein [Gemmataceae bacterium]